MRFSIFNAAKWTIIFATQFTAPLCFADKVTLYSEDQDRFDAHLNLVGEAKESVDVAFAYLHDDAVARTYLAELLKVAKTTKVRLLLNPVQCKLDTETINYLVQNGIEVKYFHDWRPTNWKLYKPSWYKGRASNLWKRMHDKLEIVDGKSMILDNQNMGANYYRHLVEEQPEIIMDGRSVRLDGETANDAKVYFDQFWNDPGSHRRKYSPLSVDATAKQEKLFADAAAKLIPATTMPTTTTNVDPDKVEFLNTRASENGANEVEERLVEMIRTAKKNIIIETPYVLLSKDMEKLLISRAMSPTRSISVTLLTNSLRTNNHPFAFNLYHAQLERLKDSGVNVQVWDGEETMHSKSAIKDDEEVLITTYNLNGRSHEHDTEIALSIRDKVVTEKVKSDLHFDRYHTYGAKDVYPQCMPMKRLLRSITKLPFVRTQY